MLVHRMRETRTAFAGVDDVGVVDDALARLATRHQQKPGHSGQRRAQCVRFGIVRLAHVYATRGEVANCGSGAHYGDGAGWEHAAGQKLLNREAPEMA